MPVDSVSRRVERPSITSRRSVAGNTRLSGVVPRRTTNASELEAPTICVPDELEHSFALQRELQVYMNAQRNITKLMNQEISGFVSKLVQQNIRLVETNKVLAAKLDVQNLIAELATKQAEFGGKQEEMAKQVATLAIDLKGKRHDDSKPQSKPKVVKETNKGGRRFMVAGPSVQQQVDPIHACIIKPKRIDAALHPQKLKEQVLGSLKPKEQRLYINKVKVLSKSKAVIIETGNKQSLKAILSDQKLKVDHEVREIGKRAPRLILKHVPSGYDRASLVKDLRDQNEDRFSNLNWDLINPKFKVGPKNKETEHWVLEVDPGVRKALMTPKTLYLGYHRLQIDDYINIIQCKKCLEYGHMASYCRKTTVTCGKCGVDGHIAPKCESVEPRCSNCIRTNKRDVHHMAWDRECPYYIEKMCQAVRSTSY